jgi:hypothetical protein
MSARSSVVRVAVVTGVVLAMVVAGGPAGAAPAKGCAGQAVSYDAKGRVLDKVTAPGKGGTDADPFHVDVKGTIAWRGATAGVITDANYNVRIAKFSVKSSKFTNDKKETTWSGTEKVGDRLDAVPVLGWLTKAVNPSAKLKVDWVVVGEGGICAGSAIIRIGDDPAFTPLWVMAILLFMLAFWLLFWPRMLIGD